MLAPVVSKHCWTALGVPPLNSMSEGRTAAKRWGSGKWKAHSSPGNNVTNAVLVCNEHVGCLKLVRVKQVTGAAVFVLKESGVHTGPLNSTKRANSAMTFEQEADVVKQLACGGRPGGMVVSMTNEVAKQLKSSGQDPNLNKLPAGGLNGVPKLAEVQGFTKRLKGSKVGGVQVGCLLQLTNFTQKMLLPPSLTDLTMTAATLIASPGVAGVTQIHQAVCVPQDALQYAVEGAVFTGPVQIQWLGQLCVGPAMCILEQKNTYHTPRN